MINLHLSSSDTQIVLPHVLPRSTKIKVVPCKFKDFTGLPSTMITNTAHITPTLASGTLLSYPFQTYMYFTAWKPAYAQYLANTVKISIPYTYKQACTYSNWLAVMKTKLNALENNNTCLIVPKPSNHHVIDCDWIFKVKYKPDGSIERYKARLIAKGFTQT